MHSVCLINLLSYKCANLCSILQNIIVIALLLWFRLNSRTSLLRTNAAEKNKTMQGCRQTWMYIEKSHLLKQRTVLLRITVQCLNFCMLVTNKAGCYAQLMLKFSLKNRLAMLINVMLIKKACIWFICFLESYSLPSYHQRKLYCVCGQ